MSQQLEEVVDAFILDVATYGKSHPEFQLPFELMSSFMKLCRNLGNVAAQRPVEAYAANPPITLNTLHVSAVVPERNDARLEAENRLLRDERDALSRKLKALPAPVVDRGPASPLGGDRLVIELPPYEGIRAAMEVNHNLAVLYYDDAGKEHTPDVLGGPQLLDVLRNTMAVLSRTLENVSVSVLDRPPVVEVQQVCEKAVGAFDRAIDKFDRPFKKQKSKKLPFPTFADMDKPDKETEKIMRDALQEGDAEGKAEEQPSSEEPPVAEVKKRKPRSALSKARKRLEMLNRALTTPAAVVPSLRNIPREALLERIEQAKKEIERLEAKPDGVLAVA